MRKLISVILLLVMLVSCAALAEENWIMYNFGDFSLTFPEDVVCAYSEERTENQPFLMFYQDYDETANFNKNLNVVWNSGAEDISAMDPAVMGQLILDQLLAQFDAMGVGHSNAMLVSAETLDHNGKPALGIAYTATVDYSAVMEDGPIVDLVFVQMIFSDEAFGTYNFTITTDDIDNTQLLSTILDSLSWNV